MSLSLYGYWRSSCTWRVRIALELKGLSYRTVPVHLLRNGGEQHAPAHLGRNPMAQVPALELADGTVLTQSLAIIDWLDRGWPEPPLWPEAPLARAQAFALAELINAGIQPLQNLGVLERLRAGGIDPAEWSRAAITRGLAAYLALARPVLGRFSVGDRLSVADLCLIPQLYNARRFSVPLEPLGPLLEIEARCAALPAFIAAHPDRQPDAVPEP